MTAVLWILLALAIYVGAVAAINRLRRPPAAAAVPLVGPDGLPQAGGRLKLVSWNVGYGGMGAEADFVMDLGEQKRPTSPALVDRNMAAIAERLADMDADVLFLQEAARPSWNTYRRDVLGAIRDRLPGYKLAFGADIDTVGAPPPINVRIGNAIFARVAATAERRGLPLEPTFEYGVFRKSYRMHVLRLTGVDGAPWTLVNIHLSAFDDARHNVRERQVEAVLAFAEAEYAAGRHVVVGGDWNLRLADTDFPDTTPAKYRFWVRDFPAEKTPAGWHWAVDRARPTVRAAHKPYVKGENFRLIIDGFLLSPNVEAVGIETIDLDFRYADHNPVTVDLLAKVRIAP